MAASKIVFDGINFTNDIEGLDAIDYEYGLDEKSKTYAAMTSSTITLTGKASEYIKGKFFDNGCSGKDQEVKVEIYDGCCDIWRNFIINYESIGSFCLEDCSIEVNLKMDSEDAKCFRELEGRVWFRGGYCENAEKIPIVWYCNNPGFLSWIAFFILRIFNVLFIPLVSAFSLTLLLGFIGALLFTIVNGVLIPSVNRLIAGCGQKVPSPLLRDIFEYHAKQCGLTFKSSILQGAYRNLVLFSVEHEQGYTNYADRKAVCDWIEDNANTSTVVQLLEKLSPVFNADFRIKDGCLYFERKDFYRSLTTPIEDIQELLNTGNYEGQICLEYIQDNSCAFLRAEYSQDAIERQGNKILNKYNDIIEWNPEGLEVRKGECTVLVEFGAARFMFDEITYKGGGYSGRADQIRKDLGREHDLILENDQTQLPKLLLLEDGYDCEDAQVVRCPLTTEREQEDGDYICRRCWEFRIRCRDSRDVNYPVFIIL